MADEPQKQSSKSSKSESGDDLSTYEEAVEQGYVGVKVDPTPNEHYTVEGVTSGKPTPETDDDAKAKADERRAELNDELSGKGGK